MMDVRTNQRELQMLSKRTRASCIRLMDSAQTRTTSARVVDAAKDELTILVKHLIVLGDGNEEDDGGDVLKAVDPASRSLARVLCLRPMTRNVPLLSLRTLSSDVEHAVFEVSDLKVGLGDSRRLDSRAKHVCEIAKYQCLCPVKEKSAGTHLGRKEGSSAGLSARSTQSSCDGLHQLSLPRPNDKRGTHY